MIEPGRLGFVKNSRRAACLMAAGTLSCLLVACSHEPAEKAPIVSVQTALVTRKPIQETVSADAVLYPLHEAAITPKVTAPVRKFYVQRGDKVHSGELLAVLENRDLAAAAQESEGAYQQAQAAYESTTAAAVPEEMKKAQLDVQSAKQALDAEQKVLESRENLYKQGAIPRKDLDQAQVSYVQAKSQYEIAEQHLAALQKVGRQQEIKSAEGQLLSAKGKYEGSQAELGYTEIRSPIHGVVTDRPLYAGETATAGTPLITVMDISQVIAKAHIPQDQAALLRVGDKAGLSAPGMETGVDGEVSVVSPATDPNSTTVEVWVRAKNPKGQLRPGTTAHVSMVAKKVPDAIVVPSSALVKSGEAGTSVMVVGPDQVAHAKAVQVGIRSDNEVQITSGLNAGDRIVTSGAYGLPDNTKVTWNTNTNAATESGSSGD
jgi:multidrug efflux pump subunit AcrA (membrane-fusion protein)